MWFFLLDLSAELNPEAILSQISDVRRRQRDRGLAQSPRGTSVWPDQRSQGPGSLLVTGLEKVNGELALMATTHGLVKLFRVMLVLA